jgi:hypothetical protein
MTSSYGTVTFPVCLISAIRRRVQNCTVFASEGCYFFYPKWETLEAYHAYRIPLVRIFQGRCAETDWTKMEELVRAAELEMRASQRVLAEEISGTSERYALANSMSSLEALRSDLAAWQESAESVATSGPFCSDAGQGPGGNNHARGRFLCRMCHEPVSLELESGTVADENGETIHELCYVERKVTSAENATLMELYALTANEQDTKNIAVLVQQINQILAAKEKRAKAAMRRPDAKKSSMRARPAHGTP